MAPRSIDNHLKALGASPTSSSGAVRIMDRVIHAVHHDQEPAQVRLWRAHKDFVMSLEKDLEVASCKLINK